MIRVSGNILNNGRPAPGLAALVDHAQHTEELALDRIPDLVGGEFYAHKKILVELKGNTHYKNCVKIFQVDA